jgi:hypothetical protein
MKKKFFYPIAALAIVAMLALNFNLSNPKSDLSELALANIEALGRNESGELFANVTCTTFEMWNEAEHSMMIVTTLLCDGKGEKTCAC